MQSELYDSVNANVYELSLEELTDSSWSEVNKRLLQSIIDITYRLFTRRKHLSIVSKTDLKVSFETSREEKNQNKKAQKA